MVVVLHILTGTRAGLEMRLKPGENLTIGRASKASEVFPDDHLMSGVHFSVELDSDHCWLRDLSSTNGTQVNGADVAEVSLRNADQISAGRTTFSVRFENASSSLPEAHAATPTVGMGLAEVLRRDFQPLYVLLDAAREPSVYKMIFECDQERAPLFAGPSGKQLAHFAPWLVRLSQGSRFVDTLVSSGWAKSWGVYMTSDSSLDELRHHFRHFLMIKLPDGRWMNFRYYDPRVLRIFLPTCLPHEATQFFGPVRSFLMESEDPGVAWQFNRSPAGAFPKEIRVDEV